MNKIKRLNKKNNISAIENIENKNIEDEFLKYEQEKKRHFRTAFFLSLFFFVFFFVTTVATIFV